MPYKDIEKYLSPGFPVNTASDTQNGFTYEYIGPDEILQRYLPKINDPWVHPGAGEIPNPRVVSRTFTPKVEGSKYSRLEIATISPIMGGGTWVGTGRKSKEDGDPRYQLRWNPQSLPLTQHKFFRDLKGADKTTFFKDVQGWENELSESNKCNYKYSPRDSDGNVMGSVVTIASGTAAYKYVSLRLLGHDNIVVFTPTWQKISQYIGTEPPISEDIGKKGNPPNPKTFTLPVWMTDKWEWVKTDDTSTTIGRTSVWERTESWTGAKHVDYDTEQVF
jgi:hypothetical protein